MAWLTGIKTLFTLGSLKKKAKSGTRWIVEHWREVALASIIGLVVYQNFFEFEFLKWFGVRTVPGLEQDLHDQQQKLDACEASRQDLKDSIEQSNQQVREWQDLAEQRENQLTKLQEDLDDMKEQTDQEIEQILEQERPQTCEGSIDLIRESIKDGEFKWDE